MSRFTLLSEPLPGARLLQREVCGDSRGTLSRLFCAEELAMLGWKSCIAQVNLTYTSRCGTIRGLHYQHPPYAEKKLVTCIQGRIWDVIVDIRADSPTFLQWYAEELSDDNHRSLLIPEGFAHGFQTLSDEVEILYCHSAVHVPAAEGGLCPLDPRLQISWPLPITEISARDHQHPVLNDNFQGIVIQ
ncbi:dTDP-4-dehydrorhamnose 3,5-epimerase family protein [Aeromonas hydrophila]|uniref:dTDP-4-dehydrorhamnose 3,5-epimerase n=1 Tax=Aeromonas hydrophila subsp. hydrophila (strain ATCC 7966 / DSM 30187 / BCRC 13018 / CCUG 14551 / JCM 1027 / KCTC 2358 / NCIMB 9240 / NCTC 8049) TaxID=380703 RepID=A0KQN6_AERHH|nr:dTDP-4-dehydrorhamnose 3,5-epimerase [Aeromonas hydrophila]ABK39879.1 dTDP-4-dehydrorhamnose 3,5-epimerase [Aeromonas hydrophila subsp. hydrophila ATCC 7966]MBS4673411.1 dTDP-4-dehydrorhamnose 3,5-epimerase family protein [Aeromonas hydrophila]MBW3833275.1 dTDP-4-dehydrorhamnose 3,5-epimerase [Aeromonas hydrophila]MBW5263880.1 dTDP-4-dehydrorhamnose 3,5-epimerase [Aeromonas hydrophila]MBW5278939.1 dTDP-4-dehydrorhamnose 3,5-epimerase [Aeromonas hydrophila]